MASLIPDSVLGTVDDIARMYKQVEEAKLTVQLAKAQASLQQITTPSKSSNPQANSGDMQESPISASFLKSGTGLALALLVGAVAVWAILK